MSDSQETCTHPESIVDALTQEIFCPRCFKDYHIARDEWEMHDENR